MDTNPTLHRRDRTFRIPADAAAGHSRGSGNDAIDMAVVDAPAVIRADAGIQKSRTIRCRRARNCTGKKLWRQTHVIA